VHTQSNGNVSRFAEGGVLRGIITFAEMVDTVAGNNEWRQSRKIAELRTSIE